MAAPPITNRIIPTAVRLDVGYQTVIAFASAPGLAIWEKTVQPPAMDGGDAIDTTTQLNCAYDTMAPQRLQKFDDIVVVAGYSTHAIPILNGLINFPDSVTIAYPDGSAWAFWAYLKKAESSALEKGQFPDITLTITITNWDPIHCVEAGPTFQQGTGSCGPYTPPNC